MKKIHILTMCIAVATAACTQDPGAYETTDTGIAFSGTVSEPSTRLAMGRETGGLSYSWEVDKDKIGIFASVRGGSIKTNAQYAAAQSAASTGFVPVSETDIIKWGVDAHEFYAYYPYNASAGHDVTAIPVSVPSEQRQAAADDVSHLPTGSFLYAKVEGATQSGGEVKFMFKNLFSTVELRLATPEGTSDVEAIILRSTDTAEKMAFSGGNMNLTTGTLDLTNATGSSEVKTTFATPLTIGTTPVKAFMTITPGHAGKTFKVYAVIDGAEIEIAEKTAPDDGIPVGVNAIIEATVPFIEPSTAINLSEKGRANTYVVNAANTEYRFIATVKGNGIARNYSWTIADDGPTYTKSYTAADMSLSPVTAGVLWYIPQQISNRYNSTCSVVIESVRFENGYIYFRTPETFQNGNVIIAAWDGEGEIIWSWTIWAVEGYVPEEHIKYPMDGETPVPIMDRNLNATMVDDTGAENGWQASGVSGFFYMWGRKDPFPPGNDLSLEDGGRGNWGCPALTPVERYQIPNTINIHNWGNTLPVIVMFDNPDRFRYLENELGPGYTLDQAVEVSIKNPFRWLYYGTNMYPNDPFHWWGNYGAKSFETRDEARYLWGAPTVLATPQKSIYDPCPPGWKVPTSSMNHALDNDPGKRISDNGFGVIYPKYDVFIPIAGFRGAHGGHIRGAYNEFPLHNSNAATDGSSGRLKYYDLRISDGEFVSNPGADKEAWGHQIRCMRDTE
jgi:hypothetical protein